MGMSDKLFYWVFQSHPDWILELQPDLAADAAGAAGSAGVGLISGRSGARQALVASAPGPSSLRDGDGVSQDQLLQRAHAADSARWDWADRPIGAPGGRIYWGGSDPIRPTAGPVRSEAGSRWCCCR